MESRQHQIIFHARRGAPLRERLAAVGLVVLLHAVVFAGWRMEPEPPAVTVSELSVSFASMQATTQAAPVVLDS